MVEKKHEYYRGKARRILTNGSTGKKETSPRDSTKAKANGPTQAD